MNCMSKSKLWQIMVHSVSGYKMIKKTSSNQPCGRDSEYIIGVFLKSFSIYIHLYWTKVKTLHLNCLPFIYKLMQASKANESVTECSKTGLCITVNILRMLVLGNAWKPFKCDRCPLFQVTNLTRNLTQFRSSEIYFNQFPLHEMVVWTCDNQKCQGLITSVFWSFRKPILKSGFFIKWPSLRFYHWSFDLSLKPLLVEK